MGKPKSQNKKGGGQYHAKGREEPKESFNGITEYVCERCGKIYRGDKPSKCWKCGCYEIFERTLRG